MNNRTKVVAFGLGFVLLLISTLVYRSEICCMFSATRYYGWPSSFISVNKTTESWDVAKKVETESLTGLLKDGWMIRFTANQMGQYGLTANAGINLITNYVLYLVIALLLIKIINSIIYKRAKHDEK